MFIRLTGWTCLSMRTHITLIDRDADNFAAWHWSSGERHRCADKGISTQYENNSCPALRLLCREGTSVTPFKGLITIQSIRASSLWISHHHHHHHHLSHILKPLNWARPHPITSPVYTHLSLSEKLLLGNELLMQQIRNALDTWHGSVIFLNKGS